MNTCDPIPDQALEMLTEGFMKIEARSLGIQPEQITPAFIAGMRRKMEPYLSLFPDRLTYQQHMRWDELCKEWAQEVLVQLAQNPHDTCEACMAPIIR
jgi:hypothetical protein